MLPIIVVLTENYSDWEIAPLTGAGRAFYDADIQFVSPKGGPLRSVAGLPIADTVRLGDYAQSVVVICGGPAWEDAAAPDISQALQRSQEKGSVIAAICGGTVALARAGLLDNVRHTSNGADYLEGLAPGYLGARHYVDQPMALRDRQYITAPAPAPASFAVEVLQAAGLEAEAARQLQTMLSLEHRL